MSASLSLSLYPIPVLSLLPLSNSRRPRASALSPLPFLLRSKTLTCCAAPGSSPSRDDLLWLREEQRWLREEQRWLREEQRWARERDALLEEIRSLKLRVQSLERRVGDGGVPPLLEVLAEKDLIVQSGGATAGPMLLEEGVVSVSPGEVAEDRAAKGEVKKGERKTLRMGSEGEEVREMQEALLKLGFYSGEEDMEFSSFSNDTQRAVKTWQATVGAREDGIMTAELLEMLLTVQEAGTSQPTQIAYQKASTPTGSEKKSVNGAIVTSITEITEIEQKVVKEDGKTEVEVLHQRVFLLGENRWEDPSRLGRQDKVVGDSKTKNTATKCLSCRGEGRLLCTECDGTGEPNVEPQFTEWIDEGLKCPYCEGLGYTICDLCEGKAMN